MTTIKKQRYNSKTRNKKHKNKKINYITNKNKKGGADFFGGLIQTGKNYNVKFPGSRYTKMLNPNLYVSIKNKNSKNNNQSKQLRIIFNYRDANKIDIANLPDNTVIDNTLTTTEPNVFINSYKYKFLVVMYRQVLNIDKTYKNLLYWLIGYYHYNLTKIFPYIEPDVRAGFTNKYIIRVYKCPETDTDTNFFRINNIDKEKAYEEFIDYINKNKPTVLTTINFRVKGNPNKGISLFNMVNKQPSQKQITKILASRNQ